MIRKLLIFFTGESKARMKSHGETRSAEKSLGDISESNLRIFQMRKPKQMKTLERLRNMMSAEITYDNTGGP